MNDYEPADPQEVLSSGPDEGKTAGPTVVEGSETTTSTGSVSLAPSSDWTISVTMAEQAKRPAVRRPLSKIRRGLIAAAALIISVTGLFVGLAASSASAAQTVAARSSTGQLESVGGGSNARSGPAAGGSSGTVGGVSKSSFILTTSAGLEVTVDELSSTKYGKGTTSTSKRAITTGDHVLVLGTVSSTTIKASRADPC